MASPRLATATGAGTSVESIISRLTAEQPAFHDIEGCPVVWNVLPGTLRLIASHIRPGDRTVETGAGASTVVFAAMGSRHTAISPRAAEHDRILAWCERAGIDTGEIDFRAESSLDGAALRSANELDAAFIDGRHAFPAPIVDWYLVSRALRVGGVLILDDVPIPSVLVVHRFMASDPAWQILDGADDRAIAYRKLADAPEGDDWRRQPFNSTWPDYGFLPARRRALASLGATRDRLRGAISAHLPALRRVRARLRQR